MDIITFLKSLTYRKTMLYMDWYPLFSLQDSTKFVDGSTILLLVKILYLVFIKEIQLKIYLVKFAVYYHSLS